MTPMTVRVLLIEAEFAAEDAAGVAAKLPLPEFVAEDDDGFRGLGLVRGESGAADERRDAHDFERIHGAVIAAQAFRLAGAFHRDVGPGGGDDAAEDRVLLGDLDEAVDLILAAVAGRAGRVRRCYIRRSGS
ncbi:MAG: hypothetical protein QM757_07985 [Paludibaculum sp.]